MSVRKFRRLPEDQSGLQQDSASGMDLLDEVMGYIWHG
jgi:hypothetical protein